MSAHRRTHLRRRRSRCIALKRAGKAQRARPRDDRRAGRRRARHRRFARGRGSAILYGEGKAFCAGGDIAAWGGLPPLEMWRDWTRAGHRAFEALARLRVPLIAALTGHAFGGGLELAAVADIRIAEAGHQARPAGDRASAWRRAGRARSGWCGASAPRWCAAWRWPGAMFSAEEALALGLVDEVAAPGEALARAEALAADVAKRGPVAVQIVKAMINAAEGEDRDAPIEGLAGALTAMTRGFAARASRRFASQARAAISRRAA